MATTQQHGIRQLGQGMTEYIIIVALVAVAAIGVYMYFGKTVREEVAGMAKEMSGQSSSTEVTAAQQAAKDASTDAGKDKTLSTYGGSQPK